MFRLLHRIVAKQHGLMAIVAAVDDQVVVKETRLMVTSPQTGVECHCHHRNKSVLLIPIAVVWTTVVMIRVVVEVCKREQEEQELT